MVHYIRLLKPPVFDKENCPPDQVRLSVVIAITTDLGDAFYPGELSLFLGIFTHAGTLRLGPATWKAGTRCLKWHINIKLQHLASRARLLFTCSDSLETDSLELGNVPSVLGAWTDEFTGPKAVFDDIVLRRFVLQKGRELDICEDNGESIGRHIWDAAIALAAWLLKYKAKVQQADGKQHCILELGSGCGLVGLVLASMSQNQNCRLILTDLDNESLKLAKYNARGSREAFNSVWQCCTLDWTEPQKFSTDQYPVLIVASDCIYNVDNIPDLVRTFSYLVRQSRESSKGAVNPKIIVSTKRRHPSEEMFFKLMTKAGFEQSDQDKVPLSDQWREKAGQDLDVVSIHVFVLPVKVGS
ncbi:MAG: hypothetical protein LQ341_000697 [Variospora aurantia]|nr:MAG: hypothetical protein LQ341_000697 [Variospora aurantia]